MEKHGCANTIDSDIYSILLEALCQLGYSQEVVKLVNFMVARRVQLKAPYLDSIAEYIKKSGEVELASHLLTMD
ncbi:hypothetical protein GIB67_030268 [Kingdonia uniflora]|uniref:Pentatricopeptide repeat-containing protein n=1 Tax=Kingdonia uniflora TaxID=39325 RepID=A0A7J7M6G7_9MAGN|nr:hypothetical protein GIB67_030268 [Kingdonia uniflora]